MSEIIELTVTNGQPTTTSLAIAERFGKQHGHVLRDIEKLTSQNEGGLSKNGGVSPKSEFGAFIDLNFQGGAYKGGNGELRPMYNITKDGFMFLAMGFTGKEAAQWKVKFIAAFNAMERQLLEAAAAQQIPRPGGTLFLSHGADIMVAADRTFRSLVRSGRSAGLNTGQAIHRANSITRERTGVDLLHTLDACDIVDAMGKPANTNGWGFGVYGVPPHIEQFWGDLKTGAMDGVVFGPMLSTQLWRLYTHWCRANTTLGEPITRLIPTMVRARVVRSARKRYTAADAISKGPHHFLFPVDEMGAPPEMHEGQWLGECVDAVNQALESMAA